MTALSDSLGCSMLSILVHLVMQRGGLQAGPWINQMPHPDSSVTQPLREQGDAILPEAAVQSLYPVHLGVAEAAAQDLHREYIRERWRGGHSSMSRQSCCNLLWRCLLLLQEEGAAADWGVDGGQQALTMG